MAFSLENYEEVKDRIPKFWAEHPAGGILTELVAFDDLGYIVKATLIDENGKAVATGLAQENVTSSGVNKTSALENCETSAIGRALANANYSTGKNRPSREEMEKVERDGGSAPPAGVRLASEKQRKLINLLVEKGGSVPETWPLADDLSMRDAVGIIDKLKAEESEPKAERRSTMREEDEIL